MHEYELEHAKIFKASGKIFKQAGNDPLNHIQVEDYTVVDYCTPSFEVKRGESTLENRWDMLSLQTPDTVLYVPCESYPTGAFLVINANTVSGSTGLNGFAGPISIVSSNQFYLDNYNLGLFVGTNAERTFESLLIERLATKTNLRYTIDESTLLIENPVNNYSIKLFAQ